MHCYLIQYDIIWENPGQNMSGISDILASLKPEPNALIVLPEMFATGFSMNSSKISQSMNGDIVLWMKTVALNYQVLLGGSVAIAENGSFFNRFIWAFPDGTIKYYDKRHLFRMGRENEYYQKGQERLIIEFNGFRILAQVCYDLRFPVWSRNRNDYDIIVYAANWPSSRQNAWNTLLPARSIENLAYVLGVNRIGQGDNVECCGNSQIIDFKGNIIEKAGETQAQICHAFLDFNKLHEFRKSFPVWQDADDFEIK